MPHVAARRKCLRCGIVRGAFGRRVEQRALSLGVERCADRPQGESHAWPWGSGHRCHGATPDSAGQCWIQVDAARANLRPEGLELVLFEDDDDPQRGLLSSDTPFGPALEEAACATDRWSGILHPPNTVSGSISASTAATDSAVSPPDFCD